jgi:hypothetical protein
VCMAMYSRVSSSKGAKEDEDEAKVVIANLYFMAEGPRGVVLVPNDAVHLAARLQ